jgi:hypothetical protein
MPLHPAANLHIGRRTGQFFSRNAYRARDYKVHEGQTPGGFH